LSYRIEDLLSTKYLFSKVFRAIPGKRRFFWRRRIDSATARPLTTN